MIGKIIIAAALLVLFALPLTAQAAVQQQSCGLVSFTVSPNSGPAGGTATVSGSGGLSMDTANLYWDVVGGTLVGTASIDQYGDFSTTINIPADAALGVHNVIYDGADYTENLVECPQPFTVVAATAQEGVQPDAYPRATLPSTGLVALHPAIGLLGGGAFLLARRRR